MSHRFESLLSIALTISAVIIAGILVHREFFPRESAMAAAAPQAPEFVPNWKEMLADGKYRGNPKARVTIVEFMDLECPFCRAFNLRLRAAEQKFGDDLSVVVVHFPIDTHRFAKLAAQAAECANAQGEFFNFFDLALAKQDSFGLKSWNSYAVEANVADTTSFDRCLVGPQSPRIAQGMSLGNRFGIRATPTVLINGWRLSEPPDDATLDRVISSLLAGETPFKPSAT